MSRKKQTEVIECFIIIKVKRGFILKSINYELVRYKKLDTVKNNIVRMLDKINKKYEEKKNGT